MHIQRLRQSLTNICRSLMTAVRNFKLRSMRLVERHTGFLVMPVFPCGFMAGATVIQTTVCCSFCSVDYLPNNIGQNHKFIHPFRPEWRQKWCLAATQTGSAVLPWFFLQISCTQMTCERTFSMLKFIRRRPWAEWDGNIWKSSSSWQHSDETGHRRGDRAAEKSDLLCSLLMT